MQELPMHKLSSIVFLTQDFLGPQTYSINYYVATLISELGQRGFLSDVEVWSHKAEQAPDRSIWEVMYDYDISNYPLDIAFRSMDALTASPDVKTLVEADIIICTMYWWGDVLDRVSRVRAAGAASPRIILWVPSLLLHEYMVNAQRPWAGMKTSVALQKKALLAADAVIFNSAADQYLAMKYYPSLNRSNCYIIYPVTRVSERRVVTTMIGERRLMGYFGRWEPRKGIQLAIEAFLRLYVRAPAWKMVIVSDYLGRDFKLSETFDKTLRIKIERLVNASALQMQAWENRRAVYLDQLRQCDIVVIPSLYDPFNMVAYDCAMLRIPMILSVFCGAEEIIRNDVPEVLRVNPLDLEEVEEAIYKLAAEPRVTPVQERSWVTYCFEDMVRDSIQLLK